MTFVATVRVGRAKRVKRIRFDEEGLLRGMHVLVVTSRGTEIATLIDEPRRDGEPRQRLRDSEALSRMSAKDFWAALQGEKSARAAEQKLGDDPDRDLDSIGGDPEAEARYLRRAEQKDVDKQNEILESTEPDEFAFFAEKVAELGLPMKPIQVEHLIGDEKILFFFTSEDRVDFRDLARQLQIRFKGRAELRRIPEREAAAMMGGIGVCGRELCCSTHLKVLKPVTLKMARAQGRPVTADANLGACGRLRCCLRYELEAYAGKEGGGCAGCGA
jgi:PSP1 C-terminal conserved region